MTKGYVPNWSEEVFVIKKLKTQCCGHMLLVILKVKKLLERFMKNNYKDKSKRVWSQKKNKRKGDKLNVEWKGDGSSFNNMIDKKNIV